MTAEQWDRILGHAKEHGIPPCAVFPDGLGCPVIVDPGVTEPRFEGARIYVSQADFVDLRRRAKRYEEQHAPLLPPA